MRFEIAIAVLHPIPRWRNLFLWQMLFCGDEQLDPSRGRRGTIYLCPQWPHPENNAEPVKNIIGIKLTVQFWNVEKNQFQFHKPAEASRECSMQGHHKGHQEHAGVPRAMEHAAWRGITSTTGMKGHHEHHRHAALRGHHEHAAFNVPVSPFEGFSWR